MKLHSQLPLGSHLFWAEKENESKFNRSLLVLLTEARVIFYIRDELIVIVDDVRLDNKVL